MTFSVVHSVRENKLVPWVIAIAVLTIVGLITLVFVVVLPITTDWPFTYSKGPLISQEEADQRYARLKTDNIFIGENSFTNTLNGGKITSSVAPVNGVDVVTKSYVDTTTSAAVAWQGNYSSATTYEPYDAVQYEGWLMIANTQTTDIPGPVPIGEPAYAYTGVGMVSDTSVSKAIMFGQRYMWNNTGYLISIQFQTVIGNTYNVYIVTDPLGTGLIHHIISVTGQVNDWIPINVPSFIPIGTTFDLVCHVQEPDPAPTVTSLNYNYLTPGGGGSSPDAGEITHNNNATDIINIHHTDNDAQDQTVFISSLVAGDIIVLGDIRWSIQGVINNTTYHSFAVAPAIQAPNDGVFSFNFEVVASVPITFHREDDYWLGNSNATGLFSADGNYANIVVDDNQYGCDIRFQEAAISDDWDFMSAFQT
jgi:hypothetical protein